MNSPRIGNEKKGKKKGIPLLDKLQYIFNQHSWSANDKSGTMLQIFSCPLKPSPHSAIQTHAILSTTSSGKRLLVHLCMQSFPEWSYLLTCQTLPCLTPKELISQSDTALGRLGIRDIWDSSLPVTVYKSYIGRAGWPVSTHLSGRAYLSSYLP